MKDVTSDETARAAKRRRPDIRPAF